MVVEISKQGIPAMVNGGFFVDLSYENEEFLTNFRRVTPKQQKMGFDHLTSSNQLSSWIGFLRTILTVFTLV